MTFEDLRRVWQEEGSGDYKRVRVEELSGVKRRASDHLNRLARLGVPLFGILLLVMIPQLAGAALDAPRPLLAWAGAVLLWGWLARGLAVWWRLWKAKPDPGLAVRDAVYAELDRLRQVERFRENIRWYLLAFVTGEMLFAFGTRSDPEGTILFCVAVLAIAGLTHHVNRRELERVVRPLREELESWTVDLEALETDGRLAR